MAAWKDKIQEKVSLNNLDPVIGEVLWKVAEDSANYSFNKSHSISYAYLAAITVYLKFNYPQEFFLSLLKFARFEPNAHEEIHKISQELSLFDIKLLPPDLNKSDIDFKIEDKNIRYGLNCIKGVSDKVLESLLEFREGSFKNKYEVFISAKQSGVNIGCLSGLIQAGLLDSFATKDRCRLVLEAQSFNILTDREKRNIVEVGEKYDFDILNCIHDSFKNKILADDNKLLFSDKRFNTFKKKYEPYKNIYEINKKHIKYANWFFEKELLGYSYSYHIRDIFKNNDFKSLISSKEIKNVENRSNIQFVGVLTSVLKRTSSNGNKYARLEIQDDLGAVCGLFMDSGQKERLTEYLSSGKKLPVKDDIIIIDGQKNEDIVFVDKINILSDKIYMKLSELK
jgi:DNA polymerase-3 subunit alpha